MPVRFSYTPPAINAALLLEAAKPAIEEAGARVILDASTPLVPVDKGALVASGTVTRTAEGAAISYSALSPEGYDYAPIQHERMDYQHQIGQAKYLEQPMHTEAGAVHAVLAEGVRAVLEL